MKSESWDAALALARTGGFEHGRPVSDASIAAVEALLGARLPPSYLDFVRACGFATIGNHNISGIWEDDPTDDGCGTMLGDTLAAREDIGLPAGLIVINAGDSGDLVPWCIDTLGAPKGEGPVVAFDAGVITRLYADFDDYFDETVKMWANEQKADEDH